MVLLTLSSADPVGIVGISLMKPVREWSQQPRSIQCELIRKCAQVVSRGRKWGFVSVGLAGMFWKVLLELELTISRLSLWCMHQCQS